MEVSGFPICDYSIAYKTVRDRFLAAIRRGMALVTYKKTKTSKLSKLINNLKKEKYREERLSLIHI